MRRYELILVLLLAPACGQRGAPTVTPERKTECAPESWSQFHVDRYVGEVRKAFKSGNAVTLTPIVPFPTDAVQHACAGLGPITTPICYEGVSSTYGNFVAKAALADDPNAADLIRRFEATMTDADPRWTAIHCRGLGGISTLLDKDHLDKLAPLLTARCRPFLADQLGRITVKPVACTTGTNPDPACDQTVDTAFQNLKWEDVCAKLGPSWYGVARAADWCAYGVGRGFGNSFPGRFQHASTFCRGPNRGACLAGIGFVATYLYPDHMEQALRLASRLAGADRDGYLEGVAHALQWRSRSDPDLLRSWIAALPPRDGQLANGLREAAQQCKLYDFGDGIDCKWPQVESCSP